MLHHDERGHGTPVVFLHGFPLDARMWQRQLDGLAAHCRAIAVDFPGFGRSASVGPFTIESLAEQVQQFVEHCKLGPIVLGGLSMGGYVALAYARKYPSNLRGLLLVDTKASADAPEAREARTRTIELVRREGTKPVAEQMLPRLLAPGAAAGRPELAAELRQLMLDCPPLAIEHAQAAMRDRPDQTDTLPSIAVPTLIIVGDQDQLTSPSLAEGMQRAIPRAQLAVIAGAGHMAPMEQPAAVNAAIERFVLQLGK